MIKTACPRCLGDGRIGYLAVRAEYVTCERCLGTGEIEEARHCENCGEPVEGESTICTECSPPNSSKIDVDK
jgi:hypothetical protein